MAALFMIRHKNPVKKTGQHRNKIEQKRNSKIKTAINTRSNVLVAEIETHQRLLFYFHSRWANHIGNTLQQLMRVGGGARAGGKYLITMKSEIRGNHYKHITGPNVIRERSSTISSPPCVCM